MGRAKLEKVGDNEEVILQLKIATMIKQWVDVNIFHHNSEEMRDMSYGES